MEENKKDVKALLRKYLGWLLGWIFVFILILIGQVVGGLLIGAANGIMKACNVSFVNSDFWTTACLYLNFIGTWIIMLLILFIKRKNRPILKMLWTDMPGNSWKGILAGIAIGGGANALCILTAWLHQDIKLYFDAFHPLLLLLMLIAVLIQSSAEELMCRAYLYHKLMDLYNHNFWLCAVLNSLFFAFLHLTNDGVTILSVANIFLTGILFSMMVYYMESLWAAFAGHMAWNYTQNIIFGLPNSGIVLPFSIFKLDASTATDSFAYNVGFGIEGTLIADIVLLLCCIAFYAWGRKRKKA